MTGSTKQTNIHNHRKRRVQQLRLKGVLWIAMDGVKLHKAALQCDWCVRASVWGGWLSGVFLCLCLCSLSELDKEGGGALAEVPR